MTKQDEKAKATDKAKQEQTSPVVGTDGREQVGRPDQEQLTRAIRQQVAQEAEAILREHDVELDEKQRSRLFDGFKEE